MRWPGGARRLASFLSGTGTTALPASTQATRRLCDSSECPQSPVKSGKVPIIYIRLNDNEALPGFVNLGMRSAMASPGRSSNDYPGDPPAGDQYPPGRFPRDQYPAGRDRQDAQAPSWPGQAERGPWPAPPGPPPGTRSWWSPGTGTQPVLPPEWRDPRAGRRDTGPMQATGAIRTTGAMPTTPAIRTTGAMRLGNIAGRGGRLPVRSRMAFASSRIACWPFVRL